MVSRTLECLPSFEDTAAGEIVDRLGESVGRVDALGVERLNTPVDMTSTVDMSAVIGGVVALADSSKERRSGCKE